MLLTGNATEQGLFIAAGQLRSDTLERLPLVSVSQGFTMSQVPVAVGALAARGYTAVGSSADWRVSEAHYKFFPHNRGAYASAFWHTKYDRNEFSSEFSTRPVA